MKVFIPIVIFCFFYSTAGAQRINSVLSDGEWVKISMLNSGVHQVTGQELKDAGLPVIGTPSGQIRLFGNGNKMLPQANSDARAQDLQEIAFLLKDGGDGIFDETDRVLFYAPDAHEIIYDPDQGNYHYQNNIYTDSTHFFLTVNNGQRKAMDSHSGGSGIFQETQVVDQFVVREEDLTNYLTSGREWYGPSLKNASVASVLTAKGIIPESPFNVTVSVMGREFTSSAVQVQYNGTSIGEIPIDPVTRYIYGQQGFEEVQSFGNLTSSGESLDFLLSYQTNEGAGYLNYILANYKRSLSLANGAIEFSLTSNLDTDLTYVINGFTASCQVWDITEGANPKRVEVLPAGNQAKFDSPGGAISKYIAFDENLQQQSPVSIRQIGNQNIHGLPTPELLIVTHPEFLEQAQRLADFREAHDGIASQVVTTQQVYNEFSSGGQDISAIRDAARYFYQNPGEDALKYLLLFGRASFDYKDLRPTNTNFVPTYQSRNSLHRVNSYSSDDYYGFMEESEGTWEEDFSGDHTLDIAVGRLPVTSWSEARDVVNKLIRYASNKKSLGRWRNQITFVADDEDQNTHQRQADQISELVDTTAKQLRARKIYVDAYRQVPQASREVAPEVNEEIDRAVEEGSVILNFTGHGSERQWTEEAILSFFMIDQWDNIDKLPLFVTATCEFGRYDDPNQISGGEKAILNPRGGAIGMVATTRPVASSSNFLLNKAFYRASLEKVNGKYKRLGDMFKDTKNTSLSGRANRNFTLLGDPSMKLALPDLSVRLTSINDRNILDADTIGAFSTIRMAGEIYDPETGSVVSDFTGVVDIELFDSQTIKQTLGNKTPVMEFGEWENAIFRGKATVSGGQFQFEFLVPKNISYQYDQGRISMYAYPRTGFQDAAGGTMELTIGGSDDTFEVDDQNPAISLFMEDSSFVDGGLTGSSTRLVAYFEDASGMNISGRGIGQEMVAILDGKEEFALYPYYTTLLDEFNRGVATLELKGLAKGMHTLTVRAFDTYNNGSEASITFRVEDSESMVIENLRNYPNPFSDETQFAFTHNRAGEDLDVLVQIYSTRGDVVKETKWTIGESPANIRGMLWDGRNTTGKKLTEGIYFYRLVVRSNKDGAKTQDYQKLVLIN